MSTWSEYFSACVYGRLLSLAGIAAHLLNTCVAYEGARPTRARTHDAGDEELGDADAQAERAAKRQRHAETRRAQRMLRHNSEAWLAGAQAERAAARNDFGGRKASSSAAASSAPEQAAAPQPLKTKKRVRWRDQHEADAACSSAAANSAPERAAAMQPPKPKKRKVKRKKQAGQGVRKWMDKHELAEDG